MERLDRSREMSPPVLHPAGPLNESAFQTLYLTCDFSSDVEGIGAGHSINDRLSEQRRSDLCHAAIDKQLDAGDVAAFI